MQVWRIASKKYRQFDGEGARRFGARWHYPGTAVVYTSMSLSLAALEVFVHFDTDVTPTGLIAIPAEIPDRVKIEHIELSQLPRNWRAHPAPQALKQIGSSWAAEGSSVALSVPSALVPMERNYLLNPNHKDFKLVQIGEPLPFRFDPRMWKK